MRRILNIFGAAAIMSALIFAQQSTTVQNTSGSEVQAGNVVSFDINLDKAPNFEHSAVLVVIAPKDASQRREFGGVQNTSIQASGGNYRVSLRIPATAPEGTWTVTSVRLLVPAGPSVPLSVSSPPEFQVHQAQAVELPASATVAVSQ